MRTSPGLSLQHKEQTDQYKPLEPFLSAPMVVNMKLNVIEQLELDVMF